MKIDNTIIIYILYYFVIYNIIYSIKYMYIHCIIVVNIYEVIMYKKLIFFLCMTYTNI